MGQHWKWFAVTASRSAFSLWIEEYERAYADPGSVSRQICPSCGKEDLHLLFVVDGADTESTTAIFWCDSCMQGLMPNRALIPPSGKRVQRGAETVPNYRLVVDFADGG